MWLLFPDAVDKLRKQREEHVPHEQIFSRTVLTRRQNAVLPQSYVYDKHNLINALLPST